MAENKWIKAKYPPCCAQLAYSIFNLHLTVHYILHITKTINFVWQIKQKREQSRVDAIGDLGHTFLCSYLGHLKQKK